MRSYLLTRMRSEAMRQTLEVNFKIAVLFLAEGKQTFFFLLELELKPCLDFGLFWGRLELFEKPNRDFIDVIQ